MLQYYTCGGPNNTMTNTSAKCNLGMGALATIELTPQWRQLTAIRHKSSDDIRPECLQLLASGRGAMHIDYGYVGLVDGLDSSSAEHGAITNMVSPAAAGIDQPSILKTDDAVSPPVHVPGSAVADIMFWWGLGTCAACPAACPAACDKDPAGWHRTAEANANISKSKFGQPSTSANGATVSFSPFQIAYVVSTAAGASPLVRLITPPPWSSRMRRRVSSRCCHCANWGRSSCRSPSRGARQATTAATPTRTAVVSLISRAS